MKRLSPSPTLSDFVKQVPGIVDQWLHQVTLRFGVIRQPTTPGTLEIPNNQWGIFKNTTTGDLTLSLNDDGTVKSTLLTTGGGGGDVLGPASAVDNRVVFFDGTTGKRIKDSGLTLSGTNTGDQTSIVGITGTLAQFNTALTDGEFATGGGTATGTNTGDQTITLTGDVTGSGSGSFATTLATVNASPQTDTFRKITVNGKGLITATTAVSSSDLSTAHGSKTANFVYAAPNGSAGTPSFRAIVAADIPTLNQNTTGTASNVTGTVAVANGGTGGTTQATARTGLGLGTISTQDSNSVSITGGSITGLSALTVANGGVGAFNFGIAHNGTLTSGRTLTFDLNDVGRTISLSGNLILTGSFATSGGNSTTLTTTGITNVTLPTTGTLATLAGSETLSNKTLTTPDIGTPSAGTLTNCSGLPVSTGISGLGAGVATFLATPSSANLKTAVTDETGSGSLVFATNPSLTTPDIGAATGTSLAATGAITSSGTAGIGYATGAGGTVTQITSKSTGVTLNKLCGEITMHNAALASNTTVRFVLTNSTIGANDVIYVIRKSGGTNSAYQVWPDAINAAGGTVGICVRNTTAGSLSEAVVLSFVVIKATTS